MRSNSTTSTGIYFAEVDVTSDRILTTQIQSVEDISSGYSSGEYIVGQPPKIQAREGLARSGSLNRATRTTRVTRAAPKKSTGSDVSIAFFLRILICIVFKNFGAIYFIMV